MYFISVPFRMERQGPSLYMDQLSVSNPCLIEHSQWQVLCFSHVMRYVICCCGFFYLPIEFHMSKKEKEYWGIFG
jgi:hypothetical protein